MIGKDFGLMRYHFEKLNKPELDFLIDNCIFKNEDGILLKMASAGKSDLEIADSLSVSTSTITKRKRVIYEKIKRFLEGMEDMTTIYVNGKRVTKEELSRMDIKIEAVKRMIAEKLTEKK